MPRIRGVDRSVHGLALGPTAGQTPGMKTLLLAILLFAPALDATGAKSPDWGELVTVGKRHGMPFPPAEAELALVHTETWTVLGNRSNARDPAFYAPGFILGKATFRQYPRTFQQVSGAGVIAKPLPVS